MKIGNRKLRKWEVSLILISSVLITDRQDTLWVNNPLFPEVIGKNFAYRDWYKNVSKDSKPSISNALLRVVGEKDIAVTIGVPIFDENGNNEAGFFVLYGYPEK